MGTNYYFIPSETESRLSNIKSIHIGKDSYGWVFSFHGYGKENDDIIGSQDGILYKTSPEPFSIRSKEDWFKFFDTYDGIIQSEYKTEFSPKEFKSLVEISSPHSLWRDKKLKSHADYDKVNTKLDNEGYPISYCNFC